MNRSVSTGEKTITLAVSKFNSAFTLEIAFALAIKFFLLTLLWWLFFAGHKQIMSDERVANKLLGDGQTDFSHPLQR